MPREGTIWGVLKSYWGLMSHDPADPPPPPPPLGYGPGYI